MGFYEKLELWMFWNTGAAHSLQLHRSISGQSVWQINYLPSATFTAILHQMGKWLQRNPQKA
jgi:hypothetical protein